MKLTGRQLEQASFPVGGIGAGCIGVTGNGTLNEWEIFNQAGKLRTNGPSHFAVRAEKDGKVLDIRMLQGDLTTDWGGQKLGGNVMFKGFGWGPEVGSMAGYPHFRECTMDGAFPQADFFFHDKSFPGQARLHAWCRFVPGESDASSLPVALFDVTITNDTDNTLDYSVFGSLSNPWGNEGADNQLLRQNELSQLVLRNNLPQDELSYGEIALSMRFAAEHSTLQRYWYRGVREVDALQVYWNDLHRAGKLPEREYAEPHHGPGSADVGTLGAHFTLAPGESRMVPFVISWFVPNRSNTWDKLPDDFFKTSTNGRNFWRNYYAKLCNGAAQAAQIALETYDDYRQKVSLLSEAMHSSTLPHYCLEGACETLSVLVSPTCLRLQDGEFWGWEGVGTVGGSCQGTCQHVWNYAQALSLLFPDLERSIRETHINNTINADGGWNFRVPVPLGIKPSPWHSCADGLFGEIMKCYREWKISGDDVWIKRQYPTLKSAMSYTWSKTNLDRWDPERRGILTGRQHHTLDQELFGPSGWLQGFYLAASKALAQIADLCGDTEFAAECREVFARGKQWTVENLFNGEYYIQKTTLDDRERLLSFANKYDSRQSDDAARSALLQAYWNDECQQLTYQIGDGCVIDGHLGQLFASLWGIGEVLPPEQIRSTLLSIFKYNFRESMRECGNTWRIYAFNDEAGCIMCTWPKGNAPAIPLPYHSEVMTGFEWAFATHLVLFGETDKAERVAQAIRQRYDGIKRNPWNELECGNNYARAMAAYAMFQVFSGFQYDMTKRHIGFAPAVKGDFQCFWALGAAWGIFRRHAGGTAEVQLLHGDITLQSVALPGIASAALNGTPLAGFADNGTMTFDTACCIAAGNTLQLICK